MSRSIVARWFARLCDSEAMRARLEISALRSALLAESTRARQSAARAQRAQQAEEHYRLLAQELSADLRCSNSDTGSRTALALETTSEARRPLMAAIRWIGRLPGEARPVRDPRGTRASRAEDHDPAGEHAPREPADA